MAKDTEKERQIKYADAFYRRSNPKMAERIKRLIEKDDREKKQNKDDKTKE